MVDVLKARAENSSSTDKLVLAILDNRPTGATGMQKIGLTVKSILEGSAPSSYAAYHYGGFDDDVAESLDALRDEGFVELVNGKVYRLTPSGRELVEKYLGDGESQRLRAIAGDVVPKLRHLSDDEVVSVVYSLFPELAEVSVIKHRKDTSPKRIRTVEVMAFPH